jgi:hypothetical protein
MFMRVAHVIWLLTVPSCLQTDISFAPVLAQVRSWGSCLGGVSQRVDTRFQVLPHT